MIQFQLDLTKILEDLIARGANIDATKKAIGQYFDHHSDELMAYAQTHQKRPPWTNRKERNW